ncbi:DUF1304 domain-containing protein [soil metagenome]
MGAGGTRAGYGDRMTVVAAIFALLAAALHVFIWTMESLTWTQPATWRRFGVASQADADTTQPMAFNQGFYNLFLAVGAVLGVVLVAFDQDDAGWALVLFACGSMLAAAAVLFASGKKYTRAAFAQGFSPLLAVIFTLLAL